MKVFASHDWGQNGANHARVKQVVECLRKRGHDVWFDDDDMRGNILDSMSDGIDRASCVVVFVTCNYVHKVWRGGSADNVRLEFMYATRKEKPIVVVRFDPDLPSKWSGPVGMVLGSQLYVDMSAAVTDDAVASLSGMIGQTSDARRWANAFHRVSSAPTAAAPSPPHPIRPAPPPVRRAPPPPPPPLLHVAGRAIRQRVDHICEELNINEKHMAEAIDRAIETLCLKGDNLPVVEKLRLVEHELGLR